MRGIELRPIGVIRTELGNEDVKASWSGGVEAEIEIYEEYADALEGVDGFSHLIVLFYMHQTTEEQRTTLKVKPRRFVRYGLDLEDLPLVGVFSVDSPHRPNPIGFTIVNVLERRGSILKVGGVDAFDGTPVLDLKPYTRERCKADIQIPAWLRQLLVSANLESPG